MRGLAFALAIAAGPALAQMTPSERFVDCSQVRAPALAFETWLTARCQRDQSCQPFAQHYHPSSDISACLFEGYLVCFAHFREDAAARETCVLQMDEITQAETDRIDLADLRERLQKLADAANGFQKAVYERRIAEIDGGMQIGCQKVAAFNVFDVAPDVFCKKFQRIHIAGRQQVLQNFIEKKEHLQ